MRPATAIASDGRKLARVLELDGSTESITYGKTIQCTFASIMYLV
jgi:hypothetical protein